MKIPINSIQLEFFSVFHKPLTKEEFKHIQSEVNLNNYFLDFTKQVVKNRNEMVVAIFKLKL